jgi:hypothetical protein
MTLMQTEPIKVEELEVTYSGGEPVKTVINMFVMQADVQPLDYLTAGAVSSLQEKFADRTVQAVKVYSKIKIPQKARVTRLNTGKKYEVHKVFNYNEFGSTCDHYKTVIYYIED